VRGLYQDSSLLGDCSLEIGIPDHQLRQQIDWPTIRNLKCIGEVTKTCGIAWFPSSLHLHDEIKIAVGWIKLTASR